MLSFCALFEALNAALDMIGFVTSPLCDVSNPLLSFQAKA